MRPVQHQLDADESEDQRKPGGEVDQPVEQALDQEEQRPQAEQCERVGGEDDVDLLSDPEHRRDRIEREQDVCAADRDDGHEQGRHHPAAVEAGHELTADVLAADRQHPPGEANQQVVLDDRVDIAVPVELHCSDDKHKAEHQEHEREQLEQRRPEGDEDGAQKNSGNDPDCQHLVLVLLGNGERLHDDDEDEHVVDRKAPLDEVAGEVLAAVLPTRLSLEDDPERHRHREVEQRPGSRLPEPNRVRPQRCHHQVYAEQHHDQADHDRPAEGSDLQHANLRSHAHSASQSRHRRTNSVRASPILRPSFR